MDSPAGSRCVPKKKSPKRRGHSKDQGLGFLKRPLHQAGFQATEADRHTEGFGMSQEPRGFEESWGGILQENPAFHFQSKQFSARLQGAFSEMFRFLVSWESAAWAVDFLCWKPLKTWREKSRLVLEARNWKLQTLVLVKPARNRGGLWHFFCELFLGGDLFWQGFWLFLVLLTYMSAPIIWCFCMFCLASYANPSSERCEIFIAGKNLELTGATCTWRSSFNRAREPELPASSIVPESVSTASAAGLWSQNYFFLINASRIHRPHRERYENYLEGLPSFVYSSPRKQQELTPKLPEKHLKTIETIPH